MIYIQYGINDALSRWSLTNNRIIAHWSTHQKTESSNLVGNRNATCAYQWVEMRLFVNDHLSSPGKCPICWVFRAYAAKDNSKLFILNGFFLVKLQPVSRKQARDKAWSSETAPSLLEKRQKEARKPCMNMLFTWIPREFTKESLSFPALFYLDLT